MLRLHWQSRISVPPAIVWSYLTEPELMNQWSQAPISTIALGDGGHPGGIGALRRVTLQLLGRSIVIDEVIERAIPGKELTYRVYAGVPVRHHLGHIDIAESGSGSEVNWRVEIDSFVPGIETAIRGGLKKELAKSLERLAEVANAQAKTRPLPPQRKLDEDAEYAQIEPQALAIRDAQRALADELLNRNDARGWFIRVYEYVSDLQIAACRAGRFDHPAWVARAVIAFDPLYRRNLEARLRGDAERIDSHWARAFDKTEGIARQSSERFVVAMRSIFEGMRAHIEDDLPRALARVYVDHYASRVDYARFRADYLRMAGIFGDASDRMMAHFPKHEWPIRDRFLDAVTPPDARTWLIDQTFYPITIRRMQAFDRGARIAELVLGAQNGSEVARDE